MSENKSTNDQVDAHFFNIVVSLSQSALFSMGKLSHPQTGKVEKNMDLARVNIDIIQMLKEKTKGNLSVKEKEIITDSLMNLQLTFADEMKKESSEKSKESSEGIEKSEGTEASKENKNPENTESEEDSEK